jgi:hypothetical protein
MADAPGIIAQGPGFCTGADMLHVYPTMETARIMQGWVPHLFRLSVAARPIMLKIAAARTGMSCIMVHQAKN